MDAARHVNLFTWWTNNEAFVKTFTEGLKCQTSGVLLTAVGTWRNERLDSTCNNGLAEKIVVWILSEMAFICIIPIAAIEFVVRGAIGLLVILSIVLCGRLCRGLNNNRQTLFILFPISAADALRTAAMSTFFVFFNLNPCMTLPTFTNQQQMLRTTQRMGAA